MELNEIEVWGCLN